MSESKKGEKAWKAANKLAGKKFGIDSVQENIKDALDTNRDGDLTADDFKGNWYTKVNWVKLVFWLSIGAAGLYFGTLIMGG